MHEIDRIHVAPQPAIVYEHGWQSWSPSAVARIRGTGRRAGRWLAPSLVSPRSAVYAEHPGWLVHGARAGFSWEADQAVLDVSDRLRDLDDWGLETTRRLLRRTPVRPFTT